MGVVIAAARRCRTGLHRQFDQRIGKACHLEDRVGRALVDRNVIDRHRGLTDHADFIDRAVSQGVAIAVCNRGFNVIDTIDGQRLDFDLLGCTRVIVEVERPRPRAVGAAVEGQGQLGVSFGVVLPVDDHAERFTVGAINIKGSGDHRRGVACRLSVDSDGAGWRRVLRLRQVGVEIINVDGVGRAAVVFPVDVGQRIPDSFQAEVGDPPTTVILPANDPVS